MTFLHNSRDEHGLDWCITRLSLLVSTAVWADSALTLSNRSRLARRLPSTVISFLLRRWPCISQQTQPSFVFWGRLAKQKNIARALLIMSQLVQRWPQAKFTIAGPDQGCLNELTALVQQYQLTDQVEFIGPVTPQQLPELAAQHTFFLQTSAYEGMSVAVVEAMQLGLIPVVTPVGEIAHYCKNHVSALFIDEDIAKLSATLADLLAEPKQITAMRSAAVQQWAQQPLYADSFLQALHKLEVAA